MDDDVGAESARLEQDRRGNGIIHHQRYIGLAGYFSDSRYVGHIHSRIGDSLDEDQPGLVIDGLGELLGIACVDKLRLDTERRQRTLKERHRAAEDPCRGDYATARLY